MRLSTRRVEAEGMSPAAAEGCPPQVRVGAGLTLIITGREEEYRTGRLSARRPPPPRTPTWRPRFTPQNNFFRRFTLVFSILRVSGVFPALTNGRCGVCPLHV